MYNDLQGHSLYMCERQLALVLPRRRAYKGLVIDTRQEREDQDSRVSRIALLSHVSCI
jgi:hypothetical protein